PPEPGPRARAAARAEHPDRPRARAHRPALRRRPERTGDRGTHRADAGQRPADPLARAASAARQPRDGAGMRRALIAAAVALGAAAPAFAFADGGETVYSGTHAANGSIKLTVSADGARVVEYSIRPISGNTCTFVASGDEGVWDGVPIVDHRFSYQLAPTLYL